MAFLRLQEVSMSADKLSLSSGRSGIKPVVKIQIFICAKDNLELRLIKHVIKVVYVSPGLS